MVCFFKNVCLFAFFFFGRVGTFVFCCLFVCLPTCLLQILLDDVDRSVLIRVLISWSTWPSQVFPHKPLSPAGWVWKSRLPPSFRCQIYNSHKLQKKQLWTIRVLRTKLDLKVIDFYRIILHLTYLRIFGPSYTGVWLCIGFWDLQTSRDTMILRAVYFCLFPGGEARGSAIGLRPTKKQYCLVSE